MSPPKESERRSSVPPESQGVMSKLPRTRPQRSSPRRAAARKATAAAQAATAAPDRSNGRPPARPQSRAARGPQRPAAERSPAGSQRARSAGGRIAATSASREPVPRQGFECESDRASGPVQPPGGAELVASAAEIVGELAKAGLSTGERLLKDVLSRLPLS